MANRGQIIGGKYEIQTFVDKGGMSRVYMALDKNLNKRWAVKEINRNVRNKLEAIAVESAIKEAHLIKQLDNPHIVRIVDIIEDRDYVYIIEDFVEGKSLDKHVAQRGALPQKLVVKWGIQLCEALDYLHNRDNPIIYRDMKPANVMLRPGERDEQDGDIKLIDFGIACREENDGEEILGTKGYAAPEQIRGERVTAASDIYSLGITLYCLLTGHDPSKPPHQVYNIRYWNSGLSTGLDKIVSKCMMPNPADRYQTCAELKYDLEHYLEIEELYVQALKNKRRRFVTMAMACVLSACVGITGLVMRNLTNEADYENNIASAERVSTIDEKVNYYCAAIRIKPDQDTAYLGLVDTFKSDTVFTTDEEKIFSKQLNANLVDLKEQDTYANLAYEVGKLYWHYYEYGLNESTTDNQMTRVVSAVQWFDDAVQHGSESDSFRTMAKVYRDIGIFNRDIPIKIMEATDKGMYLTYWSNLEEMVELVYETDEAEIVQLEVYRLVANAINSYAYKFCDDGVTQNQMETLFDAVRRATEKLPVPASGNAKVLKDTILECMPAVEEAIRNAYRE